MEPYGRLEHPGTERPDLDAETGKECSARLSLHPKLSRHNCQQEASSSQCLHPAKPLASHAPETQISAVGCSIGTETHLNDVQDGKANQTPVPGRIQLLKRSRSRIRKSTQEFHAWS